MSHTPRAHALVAARLEQERSRREDVGVVPIPVPDEPPPIVRELVRARERIQREVYEVWARVPPPC